MSFEVKYYYTLIIDFINVSAFASLNILTHSTNEFFHRYIGSG